MPPPQKPPSRLAAQALAAAPAGEDAIGRSRREKDELQETVHAIEEELEGLKAKYEAYFLGIERREPARWREEVKKKVLRVKTAFTRNAALRFRIQAVNARYLSYERLWQRSCREKEDGTYHRDVFKARLHARRQDAERADATAPSAVKETAAAPGANTPAIGAPKPGAPGSPPRPAGPAAATAAGALPGGVAEAQLRALFDEYIAAKRRCNEDVSRLTYDAVARSVTKQIPDLITRYKAKSVDFKVEVKDGRAVLKAIPKG